MKNDESVETKKTTKVKEFEYDIEQLLKNCEAVTGRKREVGEGALFGTKVDKMTKKEFQDKVKVFLNSKVKEPLKKEAK